MSKSKTERFCLAAELARSGVLPRAGAHVNRWLLGLGARWNWAVAGWSSSEPLAERVCPAVGMVIGVASGHASQSSVECGWRAEVLGGSGVAL